MGSGSSVLMCLILPLGRILQTSSEVLWRKKEITHFWLSSEQNIICRFMNYYGNKKSEKGNADRNS